MKIQTIASMAKMNRLKEVRTPNALNARSDPGTPETGSGTH